MTKVIVFHRSGGNLTVRRLNPQDRRPDETEAAHLERWRVHAKTGQPSFEKDGTPIILSAKAVDEPVIIDAADLPTSRVFRNAWRGAGVRVDVDMPMARDIHMNAIRRVRNRELDRADNDLHIAEDNNDTPEIARVCSRRKALRGISQTFDLSGATTADELMAMWPPELPPRD